MANNITADDTDVFVYTVKDGDGDLSTTTLTINLANVTVSATDTDALVNEAGLPVGSAPASNSEIFNGLITPSGGTGPYTFALTSPATGSHGTLLLNAATGTYTYTLTSPFDTTPDSTITATQTEQNKDSFSYTVTDANGDTHHRHDPGRHHRRHSDRGSRHQQRGRRRHCHRQRADRRHRRCVRGGRCGADRRGDRGCGGQQHLAAGKRWGGDRHCRAPSVF